ncbi:EamA family transporter [Spongiimicrobium sp. 3-5]|uniref:EamA family transporter n=1 Tax=Spongiimicrobium sp. 3-5 TaxID=3332596 RepID=UPI003980E83C
MFDLALSVLFSSLIFVIFKLFSNYKVETFYAIIVNYMVACLVGLFFYKGDIALTEIPTKPWFLGTVALGLLFILVFNIMAQTSQKIGVSVASVATKMSLVIPVLFGLFLYEEKLGTLKGIGIVLALASVYLASVKEKTISISRNALLLPLLVFIGSGLIDTSIKYLQATYISNNEFPLFSATVFASAASVGAAIVLINVFRKPLGFSLRNIIGGIVLGVPNYFSIYFLLKALNNEALTSASIFTINNVAIVMLSTLLGIVLFKEKISTKNWGGIALAIISIFLVALF